MVELALITGLFSYIVFGLGILGIIPKWLLTTLFFLYVFSLIILFFKKNKIPDICKYISSIFKEKKLLGIYLIFIAVVVVNFIGALGPELSFDGLWYHLTLPKLYLNFEKIVFIPGNLYYYSAMPRLIEMLYLATLSFSPLGIMAKFVHFSFGIFSAIALYKFAKRYLDNKYSLICVIIFYSTLVVGWQSTTAYIDLARTFFEILALDYFVRWFETKKEGYLLDSSALIGLAISTKLIAFSSFFCLAFLLLLHSKKIFLSIKYFLTALLITTPWLIFAYVHTKNPFYPIFSNILDKSHSVNFPSIVGMFKESLVLLFKPQDLISPIFAIFLPVIMYFAILKIKSLGFKKIYEKNKLLVFLAEYIFLTYLFWYITPRTGGSRFILPYLPVWSFFIVYFLSKLGSKILMRSIYLITILVAVINLGYRSIANLKYFPVVFGLQTKDSFLTDKLNYNFNDFYDPGGEIKKIVGKEQVLIFGSHNLFYVDFPFVHESFANKGQYYSYVLTQNSKLPQNIQGTKLIYQNEKTKVNLYLYGGKFE